MTANTVSEKISRLVASKTRHKVAPQYPCAREFVSSFQCQLMMISTQIQSDPYMNASMTESTVSEKISRLVASKTRQKVAPQYPCARELVSSFQCQLIMISTQIQSDP